jgi:protein SCO1
MPTGKINRSMFKNKSYIWISFIILIFGILVIPEIVKRFANNDVVKGNRLDGISNNGAQEKQLVIIGKAPQFELTNQNKRKIANKDFAGKVYVLEFFFTTCPTICPKMNQSMLSLQDKFFGNPNFGLASITINPKTDTAEILKNHAKLLGAKSSNWHFLTGDQNYIYALANEGFNVYVGENAKVNGGFEHSGLFALIDKNGNIRCRKDKFENPIMYYDGLDPEGVANIQQDITKLLKE